MFIVLLYTFYGKLSNAFISFSFQDSEKSGELYEKELHLRALNHLLMWILWLLCNLYPPTKKVPRNNVDCLRNPYPQPKLVSQTIRRLLRNPYPPTKTIHWIVLAT